MGLKGSKTEQNLKAAFAGESQANRRYLYFANKADVEGQNDVAALFRSTAEGETGHAHGHLEYLEAVGDPATGLPIGRTRDNLKAAVAGETHEYTDMYPGMAKTARDEGFDEIADWFETLAKAERSHANRFQKALDAAGRLTARRRSAWRTRGLRAPCSLTDRSDHDAIAKATSKRRPGIRSTGRTRSSTTRPSACKEMERIFDICHGCRRCVSLCTVVPDAVRPGRRDRTTARCDGVDEGGLREGRRPVLPVRPVLHDEVPVRSAASVERRLPAPHAARQGDQVQARASVGAGDRLLASTDAHGQARRHPGRRADGQRGEQDQAGAQA